MKILIGTSNVGKLNEFTSFLSSLPLEIVSLKDLNIDSAFEENGETYKENSQGKALNFAKLSGLPTVADDGGIEIAALNNQPGVFSRRWLGHEANDEEIIEHMKKVSIELPDNNRKAFFRTVVSFALPSGKVWSSFGEIEGIIAKKPLLKVLKGYPYRSFFYLPSIKRYYHEADLTPEQEKKYNHRYKAITKLIPIIKKQLGL